ncbi:MAG TPA: hypothetical protein VL463_36625 [Kofleriaceae bacterium]|nr:hypothetical protein [Kofleriaceae bacterium]
MSYLVAALLTTTAGGCVVRTGRPVEYRSCPPAHHWEGGVCVHNGHGNGHGRDHRDHDDDDHDGDHRGDRDHR